LDWAELAERWCDRKNRGCPQNIAGREESLSGLLPQLVLVGALFFWNHWKISKGSCNEVDSSIESMPMLPRSRGLNPVLRNRASMFEDISESGLSGGLWVGEIMKKPTDCLTFWSVVFCSILFLLGIPPSQAETIGKGIEARRLFYSLAEAARHRAGDPDHSGGPRNHPQGVVEASTGEHQNRIWSNAFGRPILFEANHGQTHPDVGFLSKLPGGSIFFTRTEIVMAVPGSVGPAHEGPRGPLNTVFRFRFEGASPEVRIEAQEPALTKSHYMTGRTPERWRTNIPTFKKIVYRGLYPGIDLCLHGSSGNLEYDFVLSPGADPERIRVKVVGGDKSEIDHEGNHVIATIDGASLRQLKPLAFQGVGTERVVVSSQFKNMGDDRFGFRVSSYDGSKPLVIDPVLDLSTYVGGARFDRGEDIAVDGQGNIYITGQTQSTDFPLESPINAQAGGSFDIFVLKFNPSGSQLVYSTYIAGSSLDIAYGIAVDDAGSAYLTGETSSGDFPFTSVFGTGGSGAFILRLSPNGSSILYAVLFGGGNLDKGYDVAVDDLGNAYVTGVTASTDFPTQNAVQSESGGGFDAFVAKFSPSGSVVYSTYLGGSADDNLSASVSGGIAIATDDDGNVYVTGDTESTDFPTVNAFQPSLSGAQDAFVAKLGATGRPLIYSTYLGGSDVALTLGERGYDIGVDGNGNAYVTGNTRSTDFPTQNPLQGALGGGNGDQDFFVSVLNPQGSGLVNSTYLGGRFAEASVAGGLAVDRCGNVSIAGTTNSNDFALENLSGTNISGTRVFLAKIEAGGAGLLYSAHIGNGSSARISLGPANAVYLTGHTSSNTFPSVNAFQGARAGDADAYVSRISHVRPVGDLPGEYRVCGDEPIEIKVARNLSADTGREWFAFLLVYGGLPSAISFLTAAGLETYVQGTAFNSYTPFPYAGNTILPEITLDALGMSSGDQIIYAYLYEESGVLNLNHIVFVTAR
jgi:hypothetical protein